MALDNLPKQYFTCEKQKSDLRSQPPPWASGPRKGAATAAPSEPASAAACVHRLPAQQQPLRQRSHTPPGTGQHHGPLAALRQLRPQKQCCPPYTCPPYPAHFTPAPSAGETGFLPGEDTRQRWKETPGLRSSHAQGLRRSRFPSHTVLSYREHTQPKRVFPGIM